MKHFCILLLFIMLLLLISTSLAAYDSLPIDATPGYPGIPEGFLPDDTGYEDETLSVRIETVRAYDTTIQLVYVKVSDPSQIRTAMADRYGTTRLAYPEILAERSNAVLAVNGDFFNINTKGYLVRQGITYRTKADPLYDILIIDDQGDFHILKDPDNAKVETFNGTIINSFNFGPALILNGEEVLPPKRIDAGTFRKAQRMAACQLGHLSYLFVATEGPENAGSAGLTVEELIHFLHDELKVPMAYNLDGGSSSSVVLGGKKVNGLSNAKRRTLCDILYFSTLIPESEWANAKLVWTDADDPSSNEEKSSLPSEKNGNR
ncbi:MAG: phosphodiester glycosidase family protein [Clostridia bacterium]|nr:phosphodiester glycosidase family protein [Clostridia bacterium]